MKNLFEIFTYQIRSKEIWKRVWELNRLKRFGNYQEYKKRVSRRITKEDVPALVVTALIAIVTIGVLNFFFTGPSLTHAIFGLMGVFVITQKAIEFVFSRRHRKEE
jgi:hypothetical protein